MINCNNNRIKLKQLNKVINVLRQDKIPVSPNFYIDKYDKKIWFCIDSKKSLLNLHTLKFIPYSIQYYKLFNDDIGIEKSLSLFYLWYEENYPHSKYKECYQSKVVAERLLNVCELFEICKINHMCILDDIFIEVISNHIYYNLLEVNYSSNNFIALYQNIAIIKASIIYNRYYIENAFNKAINISCNRLIDKLNNFIKQGQYIGNSLKECYQLFFILRDLYEYLIKNLKIPFINYLKTKLDELKYYIFNLNYPSGMIVNKYKSYYKRFLSLINKDEKRISKFLIYEKANIFIYNNNLNIKDDHYYKLIFTNGFNSPIKKDYDNLHFSLYYKDLLLFLNKNIDDYVKSRNYNNIVVDDHDYLIDTTQNNLSSLVSYGKTNIFTYISGWHILYEDVLIKRSIILFDKKIIIIDEFLALEKHEYEVNFHLHPQVLLKLNKNNSLYGIFNTNNYFYFKILYASSNFSLNSQENSIKIKLKGIDEILVTSIDLDSNSNQYLVKVDDRAININDIILIKNKYYNEIIFQNKNITEKLSLEKEFIKELKKLYINKK